ncbi:MAG: hypothetical protein IJM57_09580 [Lachnospiraceae bacterium]|nr:hypothetical protein [Lachnospiraceae bacterium]
MRFDRIVFVCGDNTCLSMIAENVFIERYEGAQLYVASRGMVVLFEAPCNPKAEAVLQKHGIEMVRTTSMELRNGDITDRTLVITMKESDRKRFESRFPHAAVYTLGALAGENRDVKDPYGGTPEDYEECYEDIDRMIREAIPFIRRLLAAKDKIDSSQLFEQEIMEEDTKNDSFRM